MDYIKGLNEKQKEAVLHTQGPLLILAGAGSGKTRVVTHKIAYLIDEKKVNPKNILAITFTNKAASEMKDRVKELIDYVNVDYMWMGTFHSIAVRILRRDIDKLGYDRSFTIYDRDDQITLVKECLKELDLNRESFKEPAILSYIGTLKDRMIAPDKFINANYKDFHKRNIGEIYALYQKKLKEYNALDFDDLLIKTVELLDKEKDLLDYYSDKFHYVFVDEYQDTNKIQYKLIRQLSSRHNNISAVGDGDQSIYGWRGADISNILDFEKDFNNARIIMLEQNYRSTSNILNLANRVISNNPNRRDKNLWTSNSQGEMVKHIELEDEREEANFVARKIEELTGEGYNLKDFAILYRTNAQSRSFEEAFMKKSIAYKIVGGLKFYDRKEIKDIVAYLRIIDNPTDNISFRRVINTPRRGIGTATLERLEDFSEKLSLSLYDGLKMLDHLELSSRARNNLEDFKNIIEDLETSKEEKSLSELIEDLINKTGYLSALEKENTIESKTRIDNIMEFLSVAVDFEVKTNSNDLNEFLTSVSLLSDVDKTEDLDNVVTMMTMHSAKGLEFPVVFIVGMEDGLFPSFRSLEDEELDEERRLCYVAITRAEKQLFITNAKIRTMYGKTNYTIPSRFLKEMEGYLEVEERNEKLLEFKDLSKSAPFNIGSFNKKTSKNKIDLEDKKDINVGEKVIHDRWGEGMVVQVKSRDDGDKELTVAFDDEGLKRLLLSLAPIKVVR